jgi:hypothetical protein
MVLFHDVDQVGRRRRRRKGGDENDDSSSPMSTTLCRSSLVLLLLPLTPRMILPPPPPPPPTHDDDAAAAEEEKDNFSATPCPSRTTAVRPASHVANEDEEEEEEEEEYRLDTYSDNTGDGIASALVWSTAAVTTSEMMSGLARDSLPVSMHFDAPGHVPYGPAEGLDDDEGRRTM